MRILMLNNEYPPIGGGTATANYHIARQLAKRGVEIDLVTSTPVGGNEVVIEHELDALVVYRIPINNRNLHYQSRRELLNYIYRGFLFIRTLYRGEPPNYDLCHAWSGVPAGALALLLKWKRGLHYVVGLRGSDVPGYDVRYRKLYPLMKPAFHAIWGNAVAITANSHELQLLAHEFRPKDEIRVIPNGIELERFKPTVLRDKSDMETFNILCVARLVERKGIGDLIDAALILKQTIPNFRIVLVGRGDYEKELKRQVSTLHLEGLVEFRGSVLHYDIPSVYNNADVFILPSLNEGMSNSILEAMASGLPIITTYTGGTLELLRGNGLIIPKQSPKEIAKAILELYHDYPLRRHMGERSLKIAESLTWADIAQEYLELYTLALSS